MSLSPRELTVLRYLMLGLSNKEISRHMMVSVGTVKVHVKAMLAKLGANKRTKAVAIARRRGLLPEATSAYQIQRQTQLNPSARELEGNA